MSDRPDPAPTAEDPPADAPASSGPASPAAAEPLTAEARIAELEAALATAQEEARVAYDRWVRERADLENLRKRMARERQDAIRFGGESMVRELLPVVDNLERALRAARAAGDVQALVQGVDLILKSLLDTLARHGVERVSAQGAPFDPSHHEAVAHVESPHEPNLVIEEHQPGYRLHDRLLRPALVTVSKGQSTS
jgi:molecular chaperone GrpE